MFKSLTLRTKLLSAFLIVGLTPLAVVSWMALSNAQDALSRQAFNQLQAVRGIKQAQIEKFFGEREGDMGVLVETVGTLRYEAINKLTAVREIKKHHVEGYFQTINDQILTFSQDDMIVQAMKGLKEAFGKVREENGLEANQTGTQKEKLGTYYSQEFSREYEKQNPGLPSKASQYLTQLDEDAATLQYYYIRANENPLGSKHLLDRASDKSKYSELHGKYHPIVRNYLDKFGYYDIFLVDNKTGDIVYSVFKELDFATSLKDGSFAQTNFGQAFRQAATSPADSVVLVDYAQYSPSYEAPASFIASPIFDGNSCIGVAMFQMPIDRINAIMSERSGLGKTGETYVVGPDKLMRSDSFLDPENHTVLASFRNPSKGKVDTDAANKALQGKTGAEVVMDYNNNPVLSAYTPLKVGNLTWALLAEIDVAEAFAAQDCWCGEGLLHAVQGALRLLRPVPDQSRWLRLLLGDPGGRLQNKHGQRPIQGLRPGQVDSPGARQSEVRLCRLRALRAQQRRASLLYRATGHPSGEGGMHCCSADLTGCHQCHHDPTRRHGQDGRDLPHRS